MAARKRQEKTGGCPFAKWYCSNAYCPHPYEAAAIDISGFDEEQLKAYVRTALKIDTGDLSKDFAGASWCKREDCQKRYHLMNYGYRANWAAVNVCPGYALPPSIYLWGAAIKLSRKEIINMYYQHLISRSENAK